jgi:carboxylate-amine ligase
MSLAVAARPAFSCSITSPVNECLPGLSCLCAKKSEQIAIVAESIAIRAGTICAMRNGSNTVVMDDIAPRQNGSAGTNVAPRKVRLRDHVFTLGIEEEFQIIDPETRELRSHIQQILADGKIVLKERLKPELHQSQVELGSEVCSDAREARRQVVDLRSELARLAACGGLKIASAGTHPFSHWMDQLITADQRYTTIVNDMQQIARVCLIFGLHVHVGIPDREEAIDIMNQARYFLPHIYALSVNSPFWLGQNTGLKAYRQMIFERFPRTGIPDAFESLSEYEDYLKLLVSTNCIDNAKKIWWDIRLHPFFDTIEFRICDAQSRVDDTIALAALMQAIVFKLQKLRRDNITFRSYPKRLIDENRWRAARYGIDGKLIDFGRRCEMKERDLLDEMLAFVANEMDELGNRAEMAHIERIMREGTGADRQLLVWEQTHELKAVVDHIVAETYQGLNV